MTTPFIWSEKTPISWPNLNRMARQSDLGPINDQLTSLVANSSASSALTDGQETFPRILSITDVQITSGVIWHTFFTSRATYTVRRLAIGTRNNAAVGTTFAKLAVYALNDDNSLTLRGATGSDLTLMSGTFTISTASVPAPFSVTAGKRYALSVLWTGTTAPRIYSPGTPGDRTTRPYLCAQTTGQADFPATIADASVNPASSPLYLKTMTA